MAELAGDGVSKVSLWLCWWAEGNNGGIYFFLFDLVSVVTNSGACEHLF